MKRRVRLGILFLCGIFFSGFISILIPLPGVGVSPPLVTEFQSAGVRTSQAGGLQAAADGNGPETDGESVADDSEIVDGEEETDGLQPFEDVIKDLSVSKGLLNVYSDPDTRKAYLGLSPLQLDQNFLLVATLDSGIGEAGLFRGWPINDLLVQFRKAPDNKLQLVVPNIYFRNPRSFPQNGQLLQQSFSDSILFALPIVSIAPDTGEILIDLQDFLMNRDPANVSAAFPWILGSYSQNAETSYLGSLMAFPENLELETVLGYSGGGGDPLFQLFFGGLNSLPDSRGFSLRVRYSLSQLPNNPAFQPRLADERVGYFVTAFRAPAHSRDSDPFVRYIHRWHLEKREPAAALSAPKEPIVFWIENAVPPEYRQAIWQGIEWWNQAFEQAGFEQAIEVRQMPDDADWDPADVRYNVVRWSESFAPWALGLGPSRVNPLTGEILDADVILDASVIRYLNQQYQTYVNSSDIEDSATALLQLCGRPLAKNYLRWLSETQEAAPSRGVLPGQPGFNPDQADYCAGMQAAQQTAFGALAINTLGDSFPFREAQENYVNQYLRALTAHEIGHVLGLRHNFLGSTLLPPDQLNNSDITESQGMLSSVMDYFPPNLAAPGQPQGDYFPTRLGPYDNWAIEYGYTPTSGPFAARRELQQIASRAGSPELAYAADEDIFDFLDPKANAWDLSADPLQYAQWQIENAKTIWDKLDWYSVDPGEGYGNLRRRVDLVFSYYLQQAFTLSNYVGGQRFNRVDPWSSRGQPPFEAIPAEEQRQALAILSQEVFSAEALQLPPELVRLLAPDRWRHWGQALTLYPLDYPIYNRVLFVQALTLSDLLYSDRLARLRDGELKAVSESPLTLAELFDTLSGTIWSEVLDEEAWGQGISSVRRGLQRHYMNILSSLVLRNASQSDTANTLLDFIAMEITLGAPEDARVLARYHLRQIGESVNRAINRAGSQMEVTSLAHLESVRDRIAKVLDAPLEAL